MSLVYFSEFFLAKFIAGNLELGGECSLGFSRIIMLSSTVC